VSISEAIANLDIASWTQHTSSRCPTDCSDNHHSTPLKFLFSGEENGNKVDLELIKKLIETKVLPLEVFPDSLFFDRFRSCCSWDSNFEVLKFLIEIIPVKRWIDMRDECDQTILHAVFSGHMSEKQEIELFKIFLTMGVPIAHHGEYGTVLSAIISGANVELLKICLEAQMDVNEKSKSSDVYESVISTLTRKSDLSRTIENRTTRLERLTGKKVDPELVLQIHNDLKNKLYLNDEENSKIISLLVSAGVDESRIYDRGCPFAHMLYVFCHTKNPDQIRNCRTIYELLKANGYCFDRIDEHGNTCATRSREFGWNFFDNEKDAPSYVEISSYVRHETGFEDDVNRPWLKNDVDRQKMHDFLLELRKDQYTKDLDVIKTTTEKIVAFFSTFDQKWLENNHNCLHNDNESLYGYLYLEPIKKFFKDRK
jgi:hypothetical protein